ncbi:MAG: D-alanyl-D-alanine carboxypeptidase family protein [Bacillota bacterium]|nr:D-alanyl-D-alanine carboxypeptidase family protein [Bacillota bacterium]
MIRFRYCALVLAVLLGSILVCNQPHPRPVGAEGYEEYGLHGGPGWSEDRGEGWGEDWGEVPALVEPPVSAERPRLDCRAAVLMEWTTGAVLYALRATEERDPASLTKIMTAVVAIEQGSLPEPVRISADAAWMPGSVMGLREGQEYTLRDLLYGLLLESGNDAAVAIAQHIAGSEQDFARLMTEKARGLGAISTRFRNPHGLTEPGHCSTAYDLALITRYALTLPLFAEMVATVQKQVADLGDPSSTGTLYNTNRLLGVYPGMEGGKTGTTAAAGACLITSTMRDGMRLISVVLDSADRWGDTRRLLDWGFANFTLVERGHAGEYYRSIPVAGGAARSVDLVLSRDLVAVIHKSESNRVRLLEELARRALSPVRRGQPLGKLIILAGERQAAEVILVAREPVPRATPFWLIWKCFLPALRWLHAAGLT